MMIEWLSGKYLLRSNVGVILDVGGVGYGVSMTLADQCRLPKVGENVTLWVYTLVREDTFKLYGFFEQEERKFFELLLTISGIGPKVALALLSTLRLDVIRYAVQQQQASVFETVPGVGKRLAEKLLMELKAKQPKFAAVIGSGVDAVGSKRGPEDFLQLKVPTDRQGQPTDGLLDIFDDLQSALENLGFRPKDISPVLSKIKTESSLHEFQPLLRLALKNLANYAHKDERGSPQESLVSDGSVDEIF